MAGYPDIVPYTFFWDCPREGELDLDELDDLRSLVWPLNQQIKEAVSWAGPRFKFVDVQATFSGHEPCSEIEYVNGIEIGNIEASYHPNAHGQYAYACQVWFMMTAQPVCPPMLNVSEYVPITEV